MVDSPSESQDAKSKYGEPEQYNVFDFYKKDSYWAKMAMHKYFESVTLGVISLNAIWIGMDADHNDSPDITSALAVFVLGENFFCFYFTFEVIVRFLAFEQKKHCLKDNWFRFDTVLVAFMVLETWIMPLLVGGGGGGLGNLSILRLLRLFRLTRMARLMRSVPELLTLIKGMVAATRSVFSTLVLLILLMYVFGIIFTSTYKDEENMKDIFGSIGSSMIILFVAGTLLDDLTNVMRRILDHSQLMCWIFIIYILAASFTVLNMLIGVLCEIVSATAQAETDEITIKVVKARLIRVFEEIDTDGSGMISKEEFEKMRENEMTLKALDTLGVEPKHLVAMSETIFEDEDICNGPVPSGGDELQEYMRWVLEGGQGDGDDFRSEQESFRASVSSGEKSAETGRGLSFDEFLESVVHLRPGTTASVLDIADLRKSLRRIQSNIEQKLQSMEEATAFMSEVVQANMRGQPFEVGSPSNDWRQADFGAAKSQSTAVSGRGVQPEPLVQLPGMPTELPSAQRSGGGSENATAGMPPTGAGRPKLDLTLLPTVDIMNELRRRGR